MGTSATRRGASGRSARARNPRAALNSATPATATVMSFDRDILLILISPRRVLERVHCGETVAAKTDLLGRVEQPAQDSTCCL